MSESFFLQIRIRIYKTRGKDSNLNPNNSLISDFFQQRSTLIYLVKFLVSLLWVLDNLCKNFVKHWQKSLVACLVCNSHSGYNSWECELELLSVSVWRMRFYLYSGWACCVRDCCSNCILHLGTNCVRSAPHCTAHGDHPVFCTKIQNIVATILHGSRWTQAYKLLSKQWWC